MGVKSKFDFSGYATKSGLRCADGRIIAPDAFKHNDGQKVPLVWQHLHNEPNNILGHAVLENRSDGVYAYGKFNETPAGINAKELVIHGDIVALSIYANALQQTGSTVVHGEIRELSLVLSGANPGAFIDNLALEHGDGIESTIIEDEAIIHTGLGLVTENAEKDEQPDSSEKDREDFSDDNLKHADLSDDSTVQDVLDSFNEIQKKVVYSIVGHAMADKSTSEMEHSDKEGESDMKKNVFDQTAMGQESRAVLTHDQLAAILADGKKYGSLKESFLEHAATYGIDPIEVLFPEARAVRNTPDMITREDSWVRPFLNAVYKTPFSRIKSMAADLTEDEARAKGYITGKRKKEEVFPVLKRTTTPTTVYKKQKLDRDDIIDITDFDVVVWLRGEMRRMLDEELARAALIGDGRQVDDENHINAQNIRPVWLDDELYAPKVKMPSTHGTSEIIDEVVRARKLYKGSGSPNFYTTEDIVTDMLLLKDLNQRRMYQTVAELASALRVKEIIAVDVMEDQKRELSGGEEVDLIGIILNPSDYTMGADKGGEVNMFDDFDIDYNQYKYLIETRCSGALTKPKTAVVIEKSTVTPAG